MSQQWNSALSLLKQEKYSQSLQEVLQMQDDLYFLRFVILCPELLQHLDRATAQEIVHKLEGIKSSRFQHQIIMGFYKGVLAGERGGLPMKTVSVMKDTLKYMAREEEGAIELLGTMN